jgi:hypothetical protein
MPSICQHVRNYFCGTPGVALTHSGITKLHQRRAAVVIGSIGTLMFIIGLIALFSHTQVAAGSSSQFAIDVDRALRECALQLHGEPHGIATSLVAMGGALGLGGFGYLFATGLGSKDIVPTSPIVDEEEASEPEKEKPDLEKT